jgi:peptidyl-prolyl cis-trans isomerase C
MRLGRGLGRHAAVLLAALIFAALVTPGVAGADATVVARVGNRVITADEVARRLAALPPFQLKAFGKTSGEIRRNFLQQVMIREALLAQGAVADKIDQREDIRDRIRGVLKNQMLAATRAEALIQQPVGDKDIRAYYEANHSKFHTPPRVAIWRIQVATEREARQVLEEIKRDPSAKRWNELAREKSLDKSTHMRGGNLGFVFPDGATSEQGVKVDPAVVAAVARVKDLEFVPEPVKDGDRFSVLWRRQSARAVDRPIELESHSIRQVLLHQRTDGRVKQLLQRLHGSALRDFHPEVVETLDVTPVGDLQIQRRPGILGSGRRGGTSPVPRQGPSGLR